MALEPAFLPPLPAVLRLTTRENFLPDENIESYRAMAIGSPRERESIEFVSEHSPQHKKDLLSRDHNKHLSTRRGEIGHPELGLSLHNVELYTPSFPERTTQSCYAKSRSTSCLPHAFSRPRALLDAAEKPEQPREVETSMEQLPIYRAIRRGNHCLLLESLRQGEDPSVVCSVTGQTYLHLIARHAKQSTERQWVPMIYQLSNAGVLVDLKDNLGATAAFIAIRRKLIEILGALLKCGAELGPLELEEAEAVRGEVRSDMMETVRRFTPTYWEAVLDPTSFKVSRLIKAWTRINISRNGQTLIEFSKQKAFDPEVNRLLIENEASIELAHAVMAGDAERARLLLCDGGADLGTTDYSVRSPTHNSLSPLSLTAVAERFDHSDVLRMLREVEAENYGRHNPKAQARRESSFKSTAGGHKGERSADLYRGSSSSGLDYHQRMQPATPTSALCVIL